MKKLTPDELLSLLGVKAVLLYIPKYAKGPFINNWQNLSFEKTRKPAWLKKLNTHKNTGVALGSQSENLVTIDLDSDLAADVFREHNPSLEGTLQTKGARGCNFWIIIEGDYPPSHKFTDLDDEPAGEWRAGGNQTVIQGIHPDGHHYSFINKVAPMKVTWDSINWTGFKGKGAQTSQTLQTIETPQTVKYRLDPSDRRDQSDHKDPTVKSLPSPSSSPMQLITEAEDRLDTDKRINTLYTRHIDECYTAKQGKRNEQLIAMVTFLFFSGSEATARELAMLYYDLHASTFIDPREQHEHEMDSHIGALRREWMGSFTDPERETVEGFSSSYQEACRTFKALANNPAKGTQRGLFFMSQSELGLRLNITPKKASRILGNFCGEKIIAVTNPGECYSKDCPRGRATEYEWRWTLPENTNEEGATDESK